MNGGIYMFYIIFFWHELWRDSILLNLNGLLYRENVTGWQIALTEMLITLNWGSPGIKRTKYTVHCYTEISATYTSTAWGLHDLFLVHFILLTFLVINHVCVLDQVKLLNLSQYQHNTKYCTAKLDVIVWCLQLVCNWHPHNWCGITLKHFL